MHVRILKIEKEDLIVTQKPSKWQVQISILRIFQLKKTKKQATYFMDVRILKIEKEDQIVTQKPSRWQVQISVLRIFQLKKTKK